MEERNLTISTIEKSLRIRPERSPHAVRELLSVGFRQRRVVVVIFLGVLTGGLLAALLRPPSYESEVKILAKRERIDPLMSAQPTAPPQPSRNALSEEELNSEVELMQAHDLLEKVVLSTVLHEETGGWSLRRLFGQAEQKPQRIAKAVRKLKEGLTVASLKDTNLISIKYRSSSPERALGVLKIWADLYLEKHSAVHRPGGQFQFFDQQAEEYRKKLQDAESRLATFGRDGAVSPHLQRDATLQKLSEFEAELQQTRSGIAETRNRIAALEGQAARSPERIVTAVRTDSNARLLQELKSKLLNLEIQRTELLAKYSPAYRTVQEVEAKIAQTRTAIASAEANPLREETTDRDPTYQWMRAELSKARSDLNALEARAQALTRTISRYRTVARRLDQRSVAQQELLRAAKASEENYLLYLRKREEARITDEMDKKRILNVAVAQAPTLPMLPSGSSWLYVLFAFVAAAGLSLASAFVVDRMDQTFRTPREVSDVLQVPVLAAIPLGGFESEPLLLESGEESEALG